MDSPPPSPNGYKGPIEYSENRTVYLLLAISLFLLLYPLLTPDILRLSKQFSLYKGLTLIFLSVWGTVYLHEGIHWAVNSVTGHSPTVYWAIDYLLPTKVTIYDSFIKRSKNILGLISPATTITFVGIVILLLVHDPAVRLVTAMSILINVPVSGADIYHVVKQSIYFPSGTKVYNCRAGNDAETYYYLPNESNGKK